MMAKKIAHIYLAILLFSCKNEKISEPIICTKLDTQNIQNINLKFTTNNNNWNAVILTATQPITLLTTYKKDTLFLNQQKNIGCTEGYAELCLASDDSNYYYSFYLKNKYLDTIIRRDYRSPKTVNPDSSLLQQQVLHNMDRFRNLISLTSNQYFYETEKKILPKTGIFKAQKDIPLSSCYVQPGSCLPFKISAKYDALTKAYNVSAGIFKDKNKNILSDGTGVVFEYYNNYKQSQITTSTLNGFAMVYIPINDTLNYSVRACINKTYSNIIKIKR